MKERHGEVFLQGKPVTLLGDLPGIGDKAPDFHLLGTELQDISLDNFQNKVVVIVSVPSLDTSVCDLEARRFNKEAANLGDDVVILVVSMDLPFAQKRWCGAAGVDRLTTASDHREASFGSAYGVLIKELRLLARAVFVIDRTGTVRYVQLVKDIGQEPDYASVLEAIKQVK